MRSVLCEVSTRSASIGSTEGPSGRVESRERVRRGWCRLFKRPLNPTVVLDVGDLLGITDHFVITSGSNVRQVRTIAEENRVARQGAGRRSPRYIEGLADARWCCGLRPVRGPCVRRGGEALLRPGATLGRCAPGGTAVPGGTSRRGQDLDPPPQPGGTYAVATGRRLRGQQLVVGAIHDIARGQRAVADLRQDVGSFVLEQDAVNLRQGRERVDDLRELVGFLTRTQRSKLVSSCTSSTPPTRLPATRSAEDGIAL